MINSFKEAQNIIKIILKKYGILWYGFYVGYVDRYRLMHWYKPKKNKAPRTTLNDYFRSRGYWKKMVDKEASDHYYKEYRKELYMDIYLVSLRNKQKRVKYPWREQA